MAKRKKTRGPVAAVVDGLLTLVDMLCEGIAHAVVAGFKGLGRLLALLVRGLWALLKGIVKALLWPFARLFRLLGARRNAASRCLRLTGGEFEAYAAQVLSDNGFRRVQVTRASGDQGVDILAERNGKTYAIQCKNYKDAVGNAAVQEAFAGAQYYGCDRAVVLCTGRFTRAAQELAQRIGVTLWDGEQLSHMMRVSGRRPVHRPAARKSA